MASRQTLLPKSELRAYRQLYMAELARACSHIASTLGPDSRNRAIAEVVNDFSRNSTGNVLAYLQLIADDLKKRQATEAAQAVLDFVRDYEARMKQGSSDKVSHS